mmetsp:Transcript_96075/g.213936  ORF Transcript_96075/g.213936 Transcript_96075/m.213936 type:complete len:288 (+) Transcript_96075:495-1358(+)
MPRRSRLEMGDLVLRLPVLGLGEQKEGLPHRRGNLLGILKVEAQMVAVGGDGLRYHLVGIQHDHLISAALQPAVVGLLVANWILLLQKLPTWGTDRLELEPGGVGGGVLSDDARMLVIASARRARALNEPRIWSSGLGCGGTRQRSSCARAPAGVVAWDSSVQEVVQVPEIRWRVDELSQALWHAVETSTILVAIAFKKDLGHRRRSCDGHCTPPMHMRGLPRVVIVRVDVAIHNLCRCIGGEEVELVMVRVSLCALGWAPFARLIEHLPIDLVASHCHGTPCEALL